MPARLLLALLLVLFCFCFPLTLAAQVRNFCPRGTCDITNPVYVNVYWETSTQAFDQDEIAAGQGDMLSGRIDALTRALTHSNYFLGLAGYSVTSATFLRGVAAGSCAPLPFTIQPPNNYLNQEMKTLTSCVLGANPDINPSTTILNVFYPPQVVPTSATADYCTKYSGDHDQFWAPVGITRIPTHPTCNPNITALFITLTHEMVEARITHPYGERYILTALRQLQHSSSIESTTNSAATYAFQVAKTHTKVSRLTSIDAASSDVESL